MMGVRCDVFSIVRLAWFNLFGCLAFQMFEFETVYFSRSFIKARPWTIQRLT
jgi:hypothetical protein